MAEVVFAVPTWSSTQRWGDDSIHNADSARGQSGRCSRSIEQADIGEAEIGQYRGGRGVARCCSLRALMSVPQNGIQVPLAGPEIEENASLGADLVQGRTEVATAVAAQTAEGISEQAFVVDGNQREGPRRVFSEQGEMLGAGDLVAVSDGPKSTVSRRQPGGGNARNSSGPPVAVVEPMCYQGIDIEHRQFCSTGQLENVGTARHGAVVVDQFGDQRNRWQAGQLTQVHAGLGMATSLQYATGASPQRQYMPRATEISGQGERIRQYLGGVRAVGGTDARRDAPGGIDGNSVGGAAGIGVASDHGR